MAICTLQMAICRLHIIICGALYQALRFFVAQEPVICYDGFYPAVLDRRQKSPLYPSARQDTVPIKERFIKQPDL